MTVLSKMCHIYEGYYVYHKKKTMYIAFQCYDNNWKKKSESFSECAVQQQYGDTANCWTCISTFQILHICTRL